MPGQGTLVALFQPAEELGDGAKPLRGHRVRPHGGFGAGEIFEFVRRSARRGQLEVQSILFASRLTDRALVLGEGVGRGRPVQLVDGGQQAATHDSEFIPLFRLQARQIRDVPQRHEVHFQRHARGKGNVGDPVPSGVDDAGASSGFRVQDVGEEVPAGAGAVFGGGSQVCTNPFRHVGVGVDLTVRVV